MSCKSYVCVCVCVCVRVWIVFNAWVSVVCSVRRAAGAMDPTVVVMEHAPPMAECHWVSLGNSRTTTPVYMVKKMYNNIYKEQILILKEFPQTLRIRDDKVYIYHTNIILQQLYTGTWVVIITNINVSTHTHTHTHTHALYIYINVCIHNINSTPYSLHGRWCTYCGIWFYELVNKRVIMLFKYAMTTTGCSVYIIIYYFITCVVHAWRIIYCALTQICHVYAQVNDIV